MILLTGGHGQLGTELRHLLDEKKIEYVSTDAINWTLLIKKRHIALLLR